MELDAFAQLEFPRLVVDRLPRRRETGNHFRIGIHLHELVEDVLGDVVVRKQVEKMRIGGRHVGRDRNLELLRRGRRCEGQQRHDHDRDGQANEFAKGVHGFLWAV